MPSLRSQGVSEELSLTVKKPRRTKGASAASKMSSAKSSMSSSNQQHEHSGGKSKQKQTNASSSSSPSSHHHHHHKKRKNADRDDDAVASDTEEEDDNNVNNNNNNNHHHHHNNEDDEMENEEDHQHQQHHLQHDEHGNVISVEDRDAAKRSRGARRRFYKNLADVSPREERIREGHMSPSLTKSGVPLVHYAKVRETRLPWTVAEIETLAIAVATEKQHWSKILKSYLFNPGRSSLDLKDKWRNMLKYGQILPDGTVSSKLLESVARRERTREDQLPRIHAHLEKEAAAAAAGGGGSIGGGGASGTDDEQQQQHGSKRIRLGDDVGDSNNNGNDDFSKLSLGPSLFQNLTPAHLARKSALLVPPLSLNLTLKGPGAPGEWYKPPYTEQ